MRYTKDLYASRVILSGLFVKAEQVVDVLLTNPSLRLRGTVWSFAHCRRQEISKNGTFAILGNIIQYKDEKAYARFNTSSKSLEMGLMKDAVIKDIMFCYLPHDEMFFHENRAALPFTRLRTLIADIIGRNLEHGGSILLRAISDIDKFSSKVFDLDRITRFSIQVQPSNPIFNFFWKDVDSYIKERGAAELTITEKAKSGEEDNITQAVKGTLKIATSKRMLPSSLKNIEKKKGSLSNSPLYINLGNSYGNRHISITDAAMLMAIDGYGEATITGKRRNTTYRHKTTDVQYHFKLDSRNDDIKNARSFQHVADKIKKERKWNTLK